MLPVNASSQCFQSMLSVNASSQCFQEIIPGNAAQSWSGKAAAQ